MNSTLFSIVTNHYNNFLQKFQLGYFSFMVIWNNSIETFCITISASGIQE